MRGPAPMASPPAGLESRGEEIYGVRAECILSPRPKKASLRVFVCMKGSRQT